MAKTSTSRVTIAETSSMRALRRSATGEMPRGSCHAPSHSTCGPFTSVCQTRTPATTTTAASTATLTPRCRRGDRRKASVSATPSIGRSTGSGTRSGTVRCVGFMGSRAPVAVGELVGRRRRGVGGGVGRRGLVLEREALDAGVLGVVGDVVGGRDLPEPGGQGGQEADGRERDDDGRQDHGLGQRIADRGG